MYGTYSQRSNFKTRGYSVAGDLHKSFQTIWLHFWYIFPKHPSIHLSQHISFKVPFTCFESMAQSSDATGISNARYKIRVGMKWPLPLLQMASVVWDVL